MRKKKIETDLALIYFLELVKTKYLHFGYWNEGDELTLNNLQAAQERFSEKMMEFIPEEFASNKKFDLVMMSESVQYIALEPGLQKSLQLLRPGGYLLAADIFKIQDAPAVRLEQRANPLLLNEYLHGASRCGFQLTRQECIAKHVLPTLLWGQMVYDDYVRPLARATLTVMQIRRPWLFGLVKMLYRPKRLTIEELLDRTPMRPEVFSQYLTYMIFLFQKATPRHDYA